ncbi:MAG: MFS transporter, partial [Gemmatimonadales bacterium]|nr:MFS transporter [Gemmatimonadales bacterium]
RSVIGWSALPGLVVLITLALVLRGTDPGKGDAPSSTRTADSADPVDARGRVLFGPLLALAALTFFRLPETLLLLRLQQRGVAVALVPLVWAALHVVRSAASYPGGWLSDRWGPRATVAAGGVLFATTALGLATGRSTAAAVVVFLAFGLVAGLTESGERALIARLAPVRTGRGFGAYHAVTGLAALPAGLVFGALYQWAGAPTALLASAAGMLVAVIAWLAVSPRHSGVVVG